MALSNVTVNNTFLEWMIKTNQLILISNDLSEGFLRKTGGTIQIDNPSFANSNVSLNVANGYIKGNGAGLTYLPNTSINGVIKNDQIQNSTITIVSNINGFTKGIIALGNTVTMNINVSTSVADTSTTNVAAAQVANTIHQTSRAAFDAANTNYGVAFDKANAANVLACTAFDRANTANLTANNANITAVGAFAKANAALANTTGTVFDGALTVTGRLAANGSNVAADVSTQTVWIPAYAMIPRNTNGPSVGSRESTTNKVMIRTLDFDAATAEYAQAFVRMPKGWNRGTVRCSFAWNHPTTVTNFGIVWGAQGVALGDTDAMDAAFGTAQEVTDTGATDNVLYTSANTAAITIAGTPAAEDMVVFQFYRNASSGSDTLAVDGRLSGVTIYYNTSTLNDS